jgi:type II secretory pathway component GspD/PulD (secretin)
MRHLEPRRALASVLLVLLGIGSGSMGAALPVPGNQPGQFNALTRTYRPHFQGELFGKVFDWLTEESGIPVITSFKIPGSGTIHADRPLTLAQTLDLINEALADQSYALVRHERSFTVLPTESRLERGRAPADKPEDLEERGNSEIVTVVLPLKNLVAKELKGEVRQMLSRYAEVVVLPTTNQLLLVDRVIRLKRVLQMVRNRQKAEKGQGRQFSQVCKYVKVSEVKRILEELLPGNQDSTIIDETKNRIVVTGPIEVIATARYIVARVDTAWPAQAAHCRDTGDPILKTYAVPAGQAESIARTLEEIYKNAAPVRITTAGKDTVLVFAGPEEQYDIARKLKSDSGRVTQVKLFSSGAQDPIRLAKTLTAMFACRTGSRPVIVGQPDMSAIAVKGTPAQVSEVAKAIKALKLRGGDGQGR